MFNRLSICLLLVTAILTGCAVNPVTGKRDLGLVPESTELSIGQEQYLPSRQMQGGDYTTEPAINTYVNQVGKRLAAVSDRPLPYEFTVINDSTPNAWALPGGKIAVNRGLLTELNSEAELAAVLGHEIVHSAARHSAKGMERGILMQGAVLAVGLASQNSEFGQLAVGGATVGAGLITQKYGRDAERESDYYGMQYMARAGYDPRAAIDLQQTFVRLSEGRSTDWLSGLFSSHPPSQERVEANRLTAAQLAAGGEIGRDRYQAQIAPLTKTKEAYEAYDQGRKALSDGQTAQALQLAEKALAIEPREALFHALRGDVRFKERRYQDAVVNYDRALERDNGYFHYYLQRGLAFKELGQQQRAVADLEQSTKLLPTAPALNALGKSALAQGDRNKAKGYFAAAAESQSFYGQEAAAALVRLDLPDNPQKYLMVRLGLDRRNYLLAQVENRTGVAVTDVELLVQVADNSGRRRQIRCGCPALSDRSRPLKWPPVLAPSLMVRICETCRPW
ncbi:MAG: M48 family metalloprotease [Syntrophotaleaceae bacterium]